MTVTAPQADTDASNLAALREAFDVRELCGDAISAAKVQILQYLEPEIGRPPKEEDGERHVRAYADRQRAMHVYEMRLRQGM